ncbi:VPLPA-CTERM sorting domain-containing protein [Desulfobulbus elongatus]|uniref:VPLPA-CTERM sorting domain-containing protein n=1 Tax=Desulfobulbus elongatus TaxID=53332 RepID=UPI0004802DD3|nr:VPLPA-CTERM sorting domain-containing protein [Desulfobulbus elongatus]
MAGVYMIVRLFVVLAWSFFVVTGAQAALVAQNDDVFGDGSLTLDTGTGLLWLDLSITSDLTHSCVSTQFGVDGDFAGYRYATADEVVTVVDTALSASTDIFAAAEYLGSFVGSTSYFAGYPEMLAMIESGQAAGMTVFYSSGQPIYRSGIFGTTYGDQFHYSGVSHWLVRESSPVPIPAAAWLPGAGMVGLIGVRRKRAG